uniref:DNA helicase Pif1-like 2B domain-containing protein n=1 Tax=Octopus bimaculoides TaxID=37653 RepID=A0A0L8GTU8_OCTBM
MLDARPAAGKESISTDSFSVRSKITNTPPPIFHDRVSREDNILLQINSVRSQIVDASLKRSFLCDHVEVVGLTTNLRLLTEDHSDEREFANYFLMQEREFKIKSDFVYADLKNNFTNPVWLANRTIVTPTYEAAQFVNDFLLTRTLGELNIYRSSDTVDNETLYSIKFINKLTPLGFSPHIIKLKEKRCIMLLRNLNATNGHCNGIHYIIVTLRDHVIETEIASGPYAGSTLPIPRIPHASQEMEFPLTFKRKQFPVKPAFALTCNKTQGQTFEQIGIYFPTQFFSHGKLYVVSSRVRKKANVKKIG